MSAAIVVGLDVGGSTTRVTVVSVHGEWLGAGRAGGGNPTTHGAERAAEQLRAALTEALSSVDPGDARAGVIGLAGAGRLLADPAGRAAFDAVWRAVGLRCPYTVLGDALVAYASGTPAPDGTVLIAGTGAIAAAVRAMTLDRVADGHGWLLGDAGSGFWLGREAVRHTLAGLDAGGGPTPLAALVLTRLLGSTAIAPRRRDTVDAVVQTVTRRPPIELAALAPLVLTAADDGDPAATAILADAARHLVTTAARIRAADETGPVVLGGGLLTGHTPLADAVTAALRDRWPQAPLLVAGDGAAAAAWLAARSLPGVDADALHHRLLPQSGA
ncbi:BadF-type ATPase [Micromonospora pattaloongensis]|uniref:BadF-type ATPase n=1 Tax=Micromonospora pattaloongensis TaxID=405436 RepID=A0A1H3QGI4_9ACTN|nr:BadF/BadG/BcrA/BcrD ATPase family protein [Micromonospora pattaloongensis]SDZ12138.1 BadF-type ATPase [Micromonospora pattaloongensis]